VQLTVIIPQHKNVRYAEVDLPVRYDDGEMPYDGPLRVGDAWKALIDLDERKVVDWPQGVAERKDYVPHKRLPSEFGDYISLGRVPINRTASCDW